MNRPYEAMVILRPQLEDEAVDAAVKKIEEYLAKNGGTVVRLEKKGKKRLAYEVKDQRDGHYLLINFTYEPQALVELDRFFRLAEEVIRHLVLRQEEAGPVGLKPLPAAVPASAVAAPGVAPAATSVEG